MKQTRKHGFTVVELVVVIAVIAILAAVLIPTFSGLVKSAKMSADTQLAKNMNTALAAAGATDGKNTSMSDVIADIYEAGYDLGKLSPTADGHLLAWDQEDDRMVYLDETYKYVYAERERERENGRAKLWLIAAKSEDVTAYVRDGFNVYLADGVSVPENTTFKLGVDVGNNTQDITFQTNETVDVIIRTNGGTLTVDAENATVNHYGNANNVTITAIAGESYHEFGQVHGKLEVQKGHAVIEASASVAQLDVGSDAKVKVEDKEKVNVIIGDNSNIEGATPTASEKTLTVYNAEDLVNAVKNADVKLIKLGDNITLTNPLCITRDVIIDGNNHEIKISDGDDQRVINIGKSGDVVYDNISVTLTNIKVIGPTAGSYTKGISIYGKNNSVNIFGSTVTCDCYAINVFKTANGLCLKVDNSTITGWSAFTIQGSNHTIEVSNSTLTGVNNKNYAANGDNNYGTITMEADTTGKTDMFGYSNSIKLTNCTVNVQSKNGNEQQLVAFNSGTVGSLACKAEFVNCTITYENNNCVLVYNGGNGNKLIIDGKVEFQN